MSVETAMEGVHKAATTQKAVSTATVMMDTFLTVMGHLVTVCTCVCVHVCAVCEIRSKTHVAYGGMAPSVCVCVCV